MTSKSSPHLAVSAVSSALLTLYLPLGFMRSCVPGRTVMAWLTPLEISRVRFKLPGSLPRASSTQPLLPADAVDLGVEGGEVAMGAALVIRQMSE